MRPNRIRQVRYHPAVVRPSMYAGEQGDRTYEQWLIDALEAYRQPGGVQMR